MARLNCLTSLLFYHSFHCGLHKAWKSPPAAPSSGVLPPPPLFVYFLTFLESPPNKVYNTNAYAIKFVEGEGT